MLSIFKQYKVGKVIWDLIRNKVGIKDFKEAMKLNEVCEKIAKKKGVKFKDLKHFRAEKIKDAIDLHNDYTKGQEINAELIIDKLEEFVNKLREKVDSDDLVAVGKLITGIATKNPRPAIEALGHFVEDIRKHRNAQ